MALTEKQQEKVLVCKNNWIRRICGNEESGEKNNGRTESGVGLEENVKKKLTRSVR